MATPFEAFVNSEIPKRVSTEQNPATLTAGKIPVSTGTGLGVQFLDPSGIDALKGPKGDKGDTGAAGPAVPQGPQGDSVVLNQPDGATKVGYNDTTVADELLRQQLQLLQSTTGLAATDAQMAQAILELGNEDPVVAQIQTDIEGLQADVATQDANLTDQKMQTIASLLGVATAQVQLAETIILAGEPDPVIARIKSDITTNKTTQDQFNAALASQDQTTPGALKVGYKGTTVSAQLDTVGVSTTFIRNALRPWYSGGLSGKNIATVGDSTVDQMYTGSSIPLNIVPKYTMAGGHLPGVTFTNFGASGNSLANFIANGPTGKGINDVIAANPQLILFSYGINDIRTGGATLAQLTALLIAAIGALVAALPNTPIMLIVPNSFVAGDTNGSNYVTTTGIFAGMTAAQAAQAASDLLKNAYAAVRDRWPSVITYDSRKLIFPDTCPAVSPMSPQMSDQIHPSATAQRQRLSDVIENYIGVYSVFATGNAAALSTQRFNGTPQAMLRDFNYGAWKNAIAQVGYRLAPTVYPQSVLCGDYDLIAYGCMSTTAGATTPVLNVYQDQDPTWPKYGSIRADDVIVQVTAAGIFACLAPYSTNSTNNANTNLMLSNMGTTAPNAVVASANNEPCFIFRNRYGNSEASKQYAAMIPGQFQTKMTFRVGGSGSGFLRLDNERGGPLNSEWTPRAGDVVCFQENSKTPITLGSTVISAESGNGYNLDISQTGTDFTTTSTLVTVYGAAVGTTREVANKPAPLQLNWGGLITSLPTAGTNLYEMRMPTMRNAKYKRYLGWLAVPDSGSATIVNLQIMRSGGWITLATVTFAAGSNTGTISFVSTDGWMPVIGGSFIRAQISVTSGSVAAGLFIGLDV